MSRNTSPAPRPRVSAQGRCWLLSVLLLAGIAGCPASRSRDPLTVALRYLEAAAAGDVDTCYSLLDESAQKSCDRTCLLRILKSQRADFRAARDELRSYLSHGRADTTQESYGALVRFRDGTQLTLGQATGPGQSAGDRRRSGYQFVENPLAFYPQASPEQALRSFLRAVERKRWDVLVSFLPRALAAPTAGPPYSAEQIRQRFEGPAQADIARQLSALRLHLDEPIQLDKSGNEARLPVGENRAARLLFEDGSWRVAQLE